MARFKVGIQLRPQHCSMSQLRDAWQTIDELSVDTIWTWDHFYPLFGEADGRRSETPTCWPTWPAPPTRSAAGGPS
jgi:alkanesulfonate monooxygenase SsuD/methylene tetrahydromethanopterin reductase-like flavin-dependent oxidoreductase (luciferase family)